MTRSSKVFEDVRVLRINVQRDRGRTRIWGAAAKNADDLIVSPSVDFHVSADAQTVAAAAQWAATELRRMIGH